MHLTVIVKVDRYILLAPNLVIFCINETDYDIFMGRYIIDIFEQRWWKYIDEVQQALEWDKRFGKKVKFILSSSLRVSFIHLRRSKRQSQFIVPIAGSRINRRIEKIRLFSSFMFIIIIVLIGCFYFLSSNQISGKTRRPI